MPPAAPRTALCAVCATRIPNGTARRRVGQASFYSGEQGWYLDDVAVNDAEVLQAAGRARSLEEEEEEED